VSQRSDVCIVGAGPAGAAAAVQLCRAGRTVVVLKPVPSGRARPGEHLAPDAHTALTALGVSADRLAGVAEPCPGRMIRWSSPEVEEASYLHAEGHAMNVDRVHFDRLLVEHAEAAGAQLILGGRLIAAAHDGGGWRLTVREDGSTGPGPRPRPGPMQLRCAVVLDATGRRAAFARSRGARTRPRDRLVAVVASTTAFRSADRRLVVEAAPDGWWYAIPQADERLVVGWVTEPTTLRAGSGGPGAAYAAGLSRTELVRELVASTAGLGSEPPQVMVAGSGLCEPISGPGWLAIGDAAAHTDPLWGRGVPHAIELGMRAAEAAALPPAHRPAGLAAYESVVRQRWLDSERARALWYRQAGQRFGTPFWHHAVAGDT